MHVSWSAWDVVFWFVLIMVCHVNASLMDEWSFPYPGSSNTRTGAKSIFPIALSHHCHSLAFAAVVWVVTAAIVVKVSNTPFVLLSDERVIRPLLHAALVLMGINTLLVLYLAIYLPKIKGIQDSSGWDVYCPRVVPSMTIFGAVAAILLIRCTWPVWGVLSPLILGAEALGALFALHFVPWLP